MSAAGRWLPLAAVTLLAGAFAFLNLGEVVPVRVGIATFYRAPLVVVVFVAFLAGMLSMLALSLRQDLRTRDLLRRHGLLDTPPQSPAPSVQPPVSPFRHDEPGPARPPAPISRYDEPDPARPQAPISRYDELDPAD